MTHRRLDRDCTAYRIGHASGRYPIFSPEGARRRAGRWHRAGDPVIYACEHYATAMLEILAYLAGVLPSQQHFITITIPNGVSYEVFAEHQAPDWREPDSAGARSFGHQWVEEARSAVLFVPCAIAPVERNLLINAEHPDFAKIEAGLETPVWWDERLFAPTPPAKKRGSARTPRAKGK
ncbi:MAG: RES domain-containing protein [Neomegalonema sp.]|nr:RES domain-containing protein [Neomegalonema sp.]